jgi:hypothetical protein
MTDRRLQAARRAAAATDEPAERARLLLERVRAGQLRRERLELAAFVGHEDARAAVGPMCAGGACPGLEDGEDVWTCARCQACRAERILGTFVQQLEDRHGRSATLRAACAAARLVVQLRDVTLFPPVRTISAAIDAAQDYAADPSPTTMNAWRVLVEAAMRAAPGGGRCYRCGGTGVARPGPGPQQVRAPDPCPHCQATGLRQLPACVPQPSLDPRACIEPAVFALEPAVFALQPLRTELWSPERAVRHVIRVELSAWALGTHNLSAPARG